MLNTSSGNPASFHKSAKNNAAEGTFSEGFHTIEFPTDTAIAIITAGIIIGKLKGVIHPTTPTGTRIEKTSISPATLWEYSPLVTCGALHANSIPSIARPISPIASGIVLPSSRPMISASSSVLDTINSRILNRTCSLAACEALAHFFALDEVAALTAKSTVAASAYAQRAISSPVEGLNTGPEF